MRSDVSEKVKINGRKNREELAQGCILDAKTGDYIGWHDNWARSVQETLGATPWGHLGRDLASTIARPRRGF